MNQNRNNIRESGERTLPDDPYRFVFERIYKWAGINFGSSQEIALDFGCGSGFGSSLLAKYFHKTYALDVSPETVAVCESSFGSNQLQFGLIQEGSQIPFQIKFPKIFSFQVIEHIPIDQVTGYLNSIYSALDKNGVAIITTPNSNNYWGGHSGFKFHVHEYSCKELEDLVKGSIPGAIFEIKGVSDIRSTRVRNFITKKGRNHLFARAAAAVISRIIFFIEKSFPSIIDFHDQYIIQESVESVSGSLMIILRK